MATHTSFNPNGHTAHERHMVEFMLVAVAVIVAIFAIGTYLYLATPGSALHCSSVRVATARC